MAKKKQTPEEPMETQQTPQTGAQTAEETPAPEATVPQSELDKVLAEKAGEHEQYLRLAAEYDNFRKRSQREKDGIYLDAVADTVKKLLPVYDNLDRALKNETADEAFKKGVEMTMAELTRIFDGLNVHPFGQPGEEFDPQRHNAVMHVENEDLGENVIADVFQTGFCLGEKVIRFAMVTVAN